jgi:tRNA-(ms[2]io[6]A)-hydroxylase
MISEANHYTMFLRLARKYADSRECVNQKWNALLEFEATLIGTLGDQKAIHG